MFGVGTVIPPIPWKRLIQINGRKKWYVPDSLLYSSIPVLYRMAHLVSMYLILHPRFTTHKCTMGTVTTLDQDQGDEEYSDFWDLIGHEGEIGPPKKDTGKDGGKIVEFEPRLYRVDGDLQQDLQLVSTATRKIHKTTAKNNNKRTSDPSFNRTELNEDDVFLVDSGWEIFVWIGSGADRYEKMAAMSAADRYAKLDPRTMELPVHIVKSGHENDAFLALFA